MACGSVAVSKASISKVVLSKDAMISMIAKLLSVPVDKVAYHHIDKGGIATYHSGEKKKIKYDYSHVRVWNDVAGVNSVTIVQMIEDGEITLELSISGASGYSQSLLTDYQAKIQPEFDRLQIIAQQTTVLKKLQQLGKLSNVQQKDNGVTARLEITI